MDFSAWFEAYLEGGWYTFDARHNTPRIGRIVIARGRDAMDVAMTHTFSTAWMTEFKVMTDELTDMLLEDAAPWSLQSSRFLGRQGRSGHGFSKLRPICVRSRH